MAKLGSWSTTPGSNNSTPPDGWPEGQAPSTVNDCAREMMASVRTVFNDAQYFDQNLTPTFVNATSFTVAGDQTSAIHAGRRLKIFDATAGVATTIYATVVTASFTVVTTISISADAGQLTSSLSSFALAILSNNNNSLPRNLTPSFGATTIAGTLSVSGATTLKAGLSVEGATVLASTLSVSGAAVFAGATTLASTLTVSGTASVLGNLGVAGTLSASAISNPVVYAAAAVAQHFTATTATILFATVVHDTHGFFRSASGVFAPSKPGKYFVHVEAAPNRTAVAGESSFNIRVFKAGVWDGVGTGVIMIAANGTFGGGAHSRVISVSSGEEVTFQAFTQAVTVSVTSTLSIFYIGS